MNDNMAETKEEKAQEVSDGNQHKIGDIAVYAASGAIGIAEASDEIKYAVNKQYSGAWQEAVLERDMRRKFDDAIKPGITDWSELVKEAHTLKDEINSNIRSWRQEKTKELGSLLDGVEEAYKRGGVPKAHRKIKTNHLENIKTIFENREYKGHWDYWTALTDTNRSRVVKEAFTAAGIAAAVGLTLVNAKAVGTFVGKIFSQKDKQNNGAER